MSFASCPRSSDSSSESELESDTDTVTPTRVSPLPPPPSLFLSSTYSGVEQREWEADICWDESPTNELPSARGGFASLAKLHLQPVSRPTPAPVVVPEKKDPSSQRESHAPPSAAELAAKFTYLPSAGAAQGSVGTWSEIGPPPVPVKVSNVAPAPTTESSRDGSLTGANGNTSASSSNAALPAVVAALPLPNSSPTAAAAYATPLPFYPPAAPVPFMGMSSQAATAAAAAAFMNLSFGNPNAAAVMINAYGMQQMQMINQLPPTPQQPPPPSQPTSTQPDRPSRTSAADSAPTQPTARVPIQFRVATKSTGVDAAVKPPPKAFQASHTAANSAHTYAKRPTTQGRTNPLHRTSFPQKHLPPPLPVAAITDSWSFVASVPSAAIVADAAPITAVTNKYINRDFAAMSWLQDVLWDSYASANDAAFHGAAIDLSDPACLVPPPLPPPPRSAHTRLIWDANDAHMIFETPEQLEAAARKERARIAKLEEEKKDEEEKTGGNRFNISQDGYYDQDQAFTSHARTERVRLAHALFAADLDEGPVEWYRTREHQTVFMPLYTRNWHADLHFLPEEGQIASHRPHLPKPLIQAMLHQPVKARCISDALVSRDHWLEVVSDRYHSESTGRRDNKIVPELIGDLTMTEGGLVLMEYLEQFPLVNLHIGMASRIVTYYRKASDVDEKQVDVHDGDVVMLNKSEQSSPFLGEIKPGMQVSAINNNLFIAPIHRHPVPNTLTPAELGSTNNIRKDMYCTFMLVRHGKKWYLRNLPTPYVVGQLEPKKIVPQPNHDAAIELQRKYIEFTIMKSLCYYKQVRLDDLVEQFGDHSADSEMKQYIRYLLREIGAVDMRGGFWQYPAHKEMPVIERIRRIFTPEDYCIYQAMMYAYHRLKSTGITSFTSPRLVSELLGHIRQPHLLRVARFIEQQLELTPWYLTKGFISCTIEEKGMLMLEGRGNPMADGAGYSYLVVDKKKKEDEMPEELKEVKKKTGTDADLRRLTGAHLENALLKFGMSPAEIKPMHRWERVRAVAKFSTEASMEGKYVNMRRFQRHVRQSLQAQMAEFKRAVNKIFEKQLNTIGFALRPDYTHEVKDDPAEVTLDATSKTNTLREMKLLKSSALTEQRQEAEEQRQYREFMEQQNASASTHDAKAEHTAAKAAGAEDGAPKKRTRIVKRKRVRHSVMTIKPDGTRETIVRYIVHPQLIAYQESDARDGGDRLRMALGLLTHDEILDVSNRGGTIIQRLSQSDLDHHVYERDTEEKISEHGDELSRHRGVRRGGGRPRGSGTAGRSSFYDRADREERGHGFGRGRGRGRPRIDRGEHHGDDTDEDEEPRSRGRGFMRDIDEEDDDDDDDDDDEEEEEDEPLRSLGQKDQMEEIKHADGTSQFAIRCGACGELGHGQANITCSRAPKEKAGADDGIIYYDDEDDRPTRGRASRRDEEPDDAVAKGLLAKGAGGALKLNLKGISAVPQSAPRRSDAGLPGGRKGKRGRGEESWQPSKRASNVGLRKRGDAKVSLNSALGLVVDYAANSGVAFFFRDPVNAQQFPDYAGIVGKRAMNLRTMKQSAISERYESREQFMSDARRILEASELYNGPHSAVTAWAQELLRIIEQQLQKPANAAKIAEAEHQYAHQQLHARLQACVAHMRAQTNANAIFGYIPSDVPGYLEKVREPMSLSTLNERILSQQYASVGEFVYDLELIRSNASLFNGPQHDIARQANALVERGMSFLSDSFAAEEMHPQHHDIAPPTFARQSSVASGTPARLTTPRFTTPRHTTPRRTPERKRTPQRTPGRSSLASPAANVLRPGTAGASSRAAAANSPAALQFVASPARLEIKTPRPPSSITLTPGVPAFSASAASSIPPMSVAAPPSPDPLQMMDLNADVSAFLPTDEDIMMDAGGFSMTQPTEDNTFQINEALGLDQLPGDSALDLGELPPE